jgi:beta-mannosidase
VVADTESAFKGKQGRASLTIKHPDLWWPAGMGEQPLYEVSVILKTPNGEVLDRREQRVGLRTLRLLRRKDAWGECFQFEANGIPFYAKGANWIPADTFVRRLSEGDCRRLLESAVAANMNMLRVWGGGIYEEDIFYDWCDRLGICVWQDFIFACSSYPTFDKEFMDNVKAEAEDNVRRLRHHACLALWCGNNELEQGAVAEKWDKRHMSWRDYCKLFDRLLPQVVNRLDPVRDYWPSSPHSPAGDRNDFNNPSCGDAHLWDVWHGRKPFEWYRTAAHRFCSEFGFQSFPEPKTVYGYTQPDDRNITGRVMEHHQRCGIGNTVIMTYLLDRFRMPKDFDGTLWLSQILQGLAIKYAVEHWRRIKPRNMGALYWQLNDCWPVASWASIDYHGRWKALHYMARRFFAPLLVSGVEDRENGTVDVVVTSDLREPCDGTLRWALTNVVGETLKQGSEKLRIAPMKSRRRRRLVVAKEREKYGDRDLILWLSLVVNGEAVSSNTVTFAKPKQMDLVDPRIVARMTTERDGSVLLRLHARHPAFYVWLELEGMDARFSDNFFDLGANAKTEVIIRPETSVAESEIRKRLRVRSLIDTY